MAIRPQPDATGTAAASAVLPRLDAVREEVAAFVADRLRWEAEAQQQRRTAEDLATGLRDLTDQVRRTEDAANRVRTEAEAHARAAEAARQDLEARLRETERALEWARTEAAANARRATDEGQRTSRILGETCRLHVLADRLEPDTLFDNILEVSVELAGAERGAYLRPADPFAIMATERFDAARPDSPLLDAVAARVAERQEPVVYNDPGALAALAVDPLAATIRNLIGYPIVIKRSSPAWGSSPTSGTARSPRTTPGCCSGSAATPRRRWRTGGCGAR